MEKNKEVEVAKIRDVAIEDLKTSSNFIVIVANEDNKVVRHHISANNPIVMLFFIGMMEKIRTILTNPQNPPPSEPSEIIRP